MTSYQVYVVNCYQNGSPQIGSDVCSIGFSNNAGVTTCWSFSSLDNALHGCIQATCDCKTKSSTTSDLFQIEMPGASLGVAGYCTCCKTSKSVTNPTPDNTKSIFDSECPASSGTARNTKGCYFNMFTMLTSVVLQFMSGWS